MSSFGVLAASWTWRNSVEASAVLASITGEAADATVLLGTSSRLTDSDFEADICDFQLESDFSDLQLPKVSDALGLWLPVSVSIPFRSCRSSLSIRCFRADIMAIISSCLCKTFRALYFTNLDAVLDSFRHRLRAPMNSPGAIEPELSSSSMMKSCCKSSWSISITRSLLRNSGTLRAPLISSSRLSSPLLSSSIFLNMPAKKFMSSLCCSSIFSAIAFTSLTRCSANSSTTAATIRFSTPNTIVITDPMKIQAVCG
mmetsp:Transcript_38029/g.68728  ORF Transcript_38029/g.68728 Transcript_38029/m.68728 type:complete len:257 (+) Transcript_38029:439-1209(+)